MKFFGYKFFKTKEIDDVFFNKITSLKHFFKKNDNLVIFDIGANVGQSLKTFKLHFPNSFIHCFEPDYDSFQILNNLEYTNTKKNNLACGDTYSKQLLNKYSESKANSIHILNKDSFPIKKGTHPNVLKCIHEKTTTQECEVITLDSYVEENNISKINIMKIDVQGYENNVLKGSKNTLKNKIIDVFLIEVTFDDIYGGKNSFYNIEQIIKEDGYELWDISHIYKDLDVGKTSWVDVIYVSQDMINKFYK